MIASTIGLPAYKQPAFVLKATVDIFLVIYVKANMTFYQSLVLFQDALEEEEEASVSLLVTPLQYQLN